MIPIKEISGRPTKRPTEEKLYELFIEKDMKRKEIAEMYGVSVATVGKWLTYYRKKSRMEEKNNE